MNIRSARRQKHTLMHIAYDVLHNTVYTHTLLTSQHTTLLEKVC